jgi:hypothetical protein
MMMKAINDAGVSAADFGKMGRKQQQIYADAIGMSADELGNMLQTQEKNAELQSKFGEKGAKVYGFLSAGATSMGQGLMETGKQLASMIIQYGIMNKLGGKSFFSGAPGSGGGPKAKTPKTPKLKSGGGKGMSGMTKAVQGIDAKKLLAGGAALLLVGGSRICIRKSSTRIYEGRVESYWYGSCIHVSISRCIGIGRCNNDEWCWGSCDSRRCKPQC